jgi:hypothetical protein
VNDAAAAKKPKPQPFHQSSSRLSLGSTLLLPKLTKSEKLQTRHVKGRLISLKKQGASKVHD